MAYKAKKLQRLKNKSSARQIVQDTSTQISTRADLLLFYNGSGGFEVGSAASFFGVTGGRSWERKFHRKSRKNSKVILELVDQIMKELLEAEIQLRIEEIMKEKASAEVTNENISWFKKGEYEKMHEDLQHIGISITYDMGWQKRATGRIYDSLSGHGYFIGCLSKNIVRYGLMKKKCSVCNCLNSTSLVFR